MFMIIANMGIDRFGLSTLMKVKALFDFYLLHRHQIVHHSVGVEGHYR